MCRGKEHTTRQTILVGMGLDMPQPCVYGYSTEKSVTKGGPYAQSHDHQSPIHFVRMRPWQKAVVKEKHTSSIVAGRLQRPARRRATPDTTPTAPWCASLWDTPGLVMARQEVEHPMRDEG
jgi:hypothetical protein